MLENGDPEPCNEQDVELDERKWKRGAESFQKFATSLDRVSYEWLCSDDVCRTANEADLQLLFLGERPATLLMSRSKHEMPDYLKIQMKQFGYEVVGRFVFDPKKLSGKMDVYNLRDEFIDPKKFLEKLYAIPETSERCLELMAIVLGYPLEATLRWRSKQGGYMDIFRELDDLKICIDHDPSNGNLADSIKMLHAESEVRQEVRRTVEFLIWNELDHYAPILRINSERVAELKKLFAEYREITSIISPFATWYDRGIPCKESVALSDRHNKAAEYSGIRYIRIQRPA